MRYNQNCSIFHGSVNSVFDYGLAFCIQSTGGFIQQEHFWIPDQSSGDSYSLLLSPWKTHPSFSH